MQQDSNLIIHNNDIRTIQWKSLLWMLLGWALSWGFGWEIGFSMSDVIRDTIKSSYNHNLSPDDLYSLYTASGLFIGGLIGGAGAGTSIAWMLRNENVIKRKISYLLLVMSWSIAGGIGFLAYKTVWDTTIGGAVCGLIGGITIVFVLWKENILSHKISNIVIPLGWILGLTLGWGIASSKFGYIVASILIWLFAGVIMAVVLSPHIKAENHYKSLTWIVLGWFIGGVFCYLEIEQGMNYIDSIIVDDVGGLMMGMFVFLRGLSIGTLVGIVFTILVLLKVKSLDYAQAFLRIVFGLIGIVLILWIVSAVLSELESDRLTRFASINIISFVISWGIMLLALRKNTVQK